MIIAAGIASAVVLQIGSASASQNDVVIRPGAPVTPAQFNGDVRSLPKIPANPIVEPGESEFGAEKHGPPAPAIPKVSTNMPATTVNFAGLDFNTWGAGILPIPSVTSARALRASRQHLGRHLDQDR